MKEEYILKINELMHQTQDIDLLDLTINVEGLGLGEHEYELVADKKLDIKFVEPVKIKYQIIKKRQGDFNGKSK